MELHIKIGAVVLQKIAVVSHVGGVPTLDDKEVIANSGGLIGEAATASEGPVTAK